MYIIYMSFRKILGKFVLLDSDAPSHWTTSHSPSLPPFHCQVVGLERLEHRWHPGDLGLFYQQKLGKTMGRSTKTWGKPRKTNQKWWIDVD